MGGGGGGVVRMVVNQELKLLYIKMKKKSRMVSGPGRGRSGW